MIELLTDYGDEILHGLLGTVFIVGAGFVLGTVLGMLLTLPLISRRRAPQWVARSFVELIRNTPFLIQAMLLFAVLGVFRLRLDPLIVGTAAVAVYVSAYMAEILRGGLHSIAAGQRDAARALALTPFQQARLVVLPQLLPFVLPAGVNLLATVTKESSFLAAMSVAELTFAGQVVIAQTYRVFEVWAIIGVLYLIVVLSILAAARHLEQRLQWAQAGR